jgi:opacity protein-like surface antigen
MKKKNYVSLLIAFALTFCIQAQEDESPSKFNIIGYGGIGYGKVKNDNQPNYNLNSNTGEILLNYNFGKRIGIATGVGFTELTGTGFNALGNFYHERTLIKIPLLLTIDTNVSDKISFFTNIGFYGHTIVEDEYRFINTTQKDVFDGWNFGLQLSVGLMFEIYDGFSAGVNFSGQSDFGKFETTANQGFSDEQRMDNLNTLGLIFMFDL